MVQGIRDYDTIPQYVQEAYTCPYPRTNSHEEVGINLGVISFLSPLLPVLFAWARFNMRRFNMRSIRAREDAGAVEASHNDDKSQPQVAQHKKSWGRGVFSGQRGVRI